MKLPTLCITILLTVVLVTGSTARPFTIPSVGHANDDDTPQLCARARRVGGLASQKCFCSLLFSKRVRTQGTRESKKMCVRFFGDKRTIRGFKNACAEYMAYPRVVNLTRLGKDMNGLVRKCMRGTEKVVFPECEIFRAVSQRRCILVLR